MALSDSRRPDSGRLLLIVFYSVGKRFALDMPHLAAGTMPEDEFDHRYVEQAWLAYLHIVPGVVYLFLAPLQLAYRIRSRHYTFHRRLGRVLATAGMISGVFALIFGGGLPEASEFSSSKTCSSCTAERCGA